MNDNTLPILEHTFTANEHGHFSLQEIYDKVAPGDRDTPRRWLSYPRTKELVEYCGRNSVDRNNLTANREIATSYAMAVSATYTLSVYRLIEEKIGIVNFIQSSFGRGRATCSTSSAK